MEEGNRECRWREKVRCGEIEGEGDRRQRVRGAEGKCGPRDTHLSSTNPRNAWPLCGAHIVPALTATLATCPLLAFANASRFLFIYLLFFFFSLYFFFDSRFGFSLKLTRNRNRLKFLEFQLDLVLL